jgi:hypothetical protein
MPQDRDDRDDEIVQDTSEKISYQILFSLQNRFESVKQQHARLIKNEPSMSALDIDQALRNIFADLQTLVQETLGYATTRRKRKAFISALHAAKKSAKGNRDLEITAVWRTVQEYLERMNLLLSNQPVDADYVEELWSNIVSSALETYLLERAAKEAAAAADMDEFEGGNAP